MRILEVEHEVTLRWAFNALVESVCAGHERIAEVGGEEEPPVASGDHEG